MYFAMTLLALAGLFVAITGFIQILYMAFSRSVLWGLIALFVPLGFLVFSIRNWQRTSYSLGLCLGGFALAALIWVSLPYIAPLPALV